MKVHEYQAKELLARYGVPIPRGRVATTPEEAKTIAAELACATIVKAQIHAGGRGKGGGIKLASTPEDAEAAARQILGMTLVTPQTGPEGRLVRKVLVEEQVPVQRELYLAALIDASIARVVLMASASGGMDIEQLAAEHPEQIEKIEVDPSSGFQPFIGREVAAALNLDNARQKQVTEIVAAAIYRMFVEEDCSLAEINPLVVTEDGKLLALDAKINFDDNALYRQRDISALRDFDEEDPLEVQAHKDGIQNYVKLDGNIGCVVNGAGLAMATMDAIKLAGGDPANFLDIGTVNDPERVVNAFRLLIVDRQVKAILINIFGGMARVDIIAQGIIAAMRELRSDVPVVVRVAGTNLEEGLRLLAESQLPVHLAEDLGDAATKAVAAAAAAAVR